MPKLVLILSHHGRKSQTQETRRIKVEGTPLPSTCKADRTEVLQEESTQTKPAAEGIGSQDNIIKRSICIASIIITQDNPNPTHENVSVQLWHKMNIDKKDALSRQK